MSYNLRRGGYVQPNSVGLRRPQGNFSQGQRMSTPQGRGGGSGPGWNNQNSQQGQNQGNLRQQAQTFLQKQGSQPKQDVRPQQQQQPQQQQKQQQPQQQQQKPPQQPQQQQQKPPQQAQQQQQSPQQQKQQPPPLLNQLQLKTENANSPVVVPMKIEPPVTPNTNSNPNSEEQPEEVATSTEATPPDQDVEMTEDGDKTTRKANKPFWVKGPGKVNKKELRRRRNVRLRKILQPKNALMVLNELVGSAPYEVTDLPDPFNGTSFQCSVQVDGMQHLGLGKSKPAAKNAAAEAALKHMVLGKMKNLQTANPSIVPEEDVEMKMELDEGDAGVSWSHVACYALHKLLNSWDEGSGINFSEKVGLGGDSLDTSKNVEKKPAKKLPELANTMNPVMLLNQMFPSAIFEEVSREGNPPNIQFTVKCIVGNDTFFGTGTTKKIARRMCSFAACRHILGIEYTPAFLEEQGFSEDAVKLVSGSQ